MTSFPRASINSCWMCTYIAAPPDSSQSANNSGKLDVSRFNNTYFYSNFSFTSLRAMSRLARLTRIVRAQCTVRFSPMALTLRRLQFNAASDPRRIQHHLEHANNCAGWQSPSSPRTCLINTRLQPQPRQIAGERLAPSAQCRLTMASAQCRLTVALTLNRWHTICVLPCSRSPTRRIHPA